MYGKTKAERRHWSSFAQFSLSTVLALSIIAAAGSFPSFAQEHGAQLRISIVDQGGAGVQARIALSHTATFKLVASADVGGTYVAKGLRPGKYKVQISHPGSMSVTHHVTLALNERRKLVVVLPATQTTIKVEVQSAAENDPANPDTVYSIDHRSLQRQMSAQPGRIISNSVNDQPGWLYEANGALHPRGSEYGVQYVANGLPIGENRSTAFATPISAEGVEQLSVRTAGIPAEYGRKLGAVVEMTTGPESPNGIHGDFSTSFGSFFSLSQQGRLTYARGANEFGISGQNERTDRFLDPPVPANFTNTGSFNSESGSFLHSSSAGARLRVSIWHGLSSFLVPNELGQQEAGQRETHNNGENGGQVTYGRPLSTSTMLSLSVRLRDLRSDLNSNAAATPMIVAQRRGLREGYLKAALSGRSGRHFWKLGADGLFADLHEQLQYQITDPTQFDSDVKQTFAFGNRGRDHEQAAFAEDEFHAAKWTFSLGLRFDHYRFLVNESAWSPRASVSRKLPFGIFVHASYDRVLNTPAIENLLLASSPLVNQISNTVLRVPIHPAHANYYEVGATKRVGPFEVRINQFRRDFHNFPDDDVLLDTGVSFPMSFANARIHGTEIKLDLKSFHRLSGFLSHANQIGYGYGPVTGGLLLGAEASSSLSNHSRFAITQDQRNTVRASIAYQISRKAWASTTAEYGSGLPVELDITAVAPAGLAAQHGSAVLSRVNLARGRVRPSFSLNITGGVQLYSRQRAGLFLQAQIANLTNRLSVINFAGLFSGTAIAGPRSVSTQLRVEF